MLIMQFGHDQASFTAFTKMQHLMFTKIDTFSRLRFKVALVIAV